MLMNARARAAMGVLAGLGCCFAAQADLPEYTDFELQARSNFSVNGGAFNMPDDAFFTSSTPVVNDNQIFAIKVGAIAGTDSQAILSGDEGNAEFVYTTPAGGFLSDVSINNAGDIVTEQSFTSEDGLWIYDAQSESAARETTLPLGASGWGSPQINTNNQLGYRASFNGPRAFVSYEDDATEFHATDVGLEPGSPYSFLFTPAFNNNRQIAGKVRLGGPGEVGNDQPDQIRLFETDGSSTLIAEDQDSNSKSPYASFDNGVSVNDNQQVAFTASLVAGGRGVFLSDGDTTLTIATTADPMLNGVEFFKPVVSNSGVVAFRGVDSDGLQAIFVGDGDSLIRLIGEHDIVDTDLGPARLDQHDGSPIFGGAPGINNSGEVIFAAGLTPPDNNQIEWGSGIFIAVTGPCQVPGDITGGPGGEPDCIVDTQDLLALLAAWGPCEDPCPPSCPADFTGPGDEPDCEVGTADLLLLLSNWGG